MKHFLVRMLQMYVNLLKFTNLSSWLCYLKIKLHILVHKFHILAAKVLHQQLLTLKPHSGRGWCNLWLIGDQEWEFYSSGSFFPVIFLFPFFCSITSTQPMWCKWRKGWKRRKKQRTKNFFSSLDHRWPLSVQSNPKEDV